MQRKTIILTAVACGLVLAGDVRAQDTTNALRTNLEAFDAQTGTVIIRGSALIGTIDGQTGTVSVRCRESVEPGVGAREYGISVELREANRTEDVTTVDYEELNSFLNGLDQLGKASHTVTSLPNFDVLYTTGGGLRADVYTSDKRSGAVQASLQSSRSNRTRVLLTVDQLAHFRSLVQQAKSRLDQLRENR
jgi:hypothetical protein